MVVDLLFLGLSKGVHTGWGVSCGRHVNADGFAADTRCKKAISKTPDLTQAEARLRLKRWLVAAAHFLLEPGRERQSHIGLGGKSLAEFASTTEWGEFGDEDLDELLEALD